MDAANFLAAQGLRVDGSVELVLVSALPPHASASAIGSYFRSERRAYLLSYQAFLKCQLWFGIPVNRGLYRSLAAHEVAHALAADNFRIGQPAVQAQEYIAYVTMFSTMDDNNRRRILARHPGPGYAGDWQMSTTIYMMDPLRYGVRAYRHFGELENGRVYLRHVLDGKALAE